jgi:hypothetical protein
LSRNGQEFALFCKPIFPAIAIYSDQSKFSGPTYFEGVLNSLSPRRPALTVNRWKFKGCTVEDVPWDNTFIFMLAHSSREEAKKKWDEFAADPEFQQVVKSEQTEKTVEKVEVTYMRPTDFSPMK